MKHLFMAVLMLMMATMVQASMCSTVDEEYQKTPFPQQIDSVTYCLGGGCKDDVVTNNYLTTSQLFSDLSENKGFREIVKDHVCGSEGAKMLNRMGLTVKYVYYMDKTYEHVMTATCPREEI